MRGAIQIYIAFTVFCMLAMVSYAIAHKGSLYEFANMMIVALTEKVYLQDLIKHYDAGLIQF